MARQGEVRIYIIQGKAGFARVWLGKAVLGRDYVHGRARRGLVRYSTAGRGEDYRLGAVRYGPQGWEWCSQARFG